MGEGTEAIPVKAAVVITPHTCFIHQKSTVSDAKRILEKSGQRFFPLVNMVEGETSEFQSGRMPKMKLIGEVTRRRLIDAVTWAERGKRGLGFHTSISFKVSDADNRTFLFAVDATQIVSKN